MTYCFALSAALLGSIDHVLVYKKDGRIRPDLSDWWLPGPPPCLPHAGVSLGEEGKGGMVVPRTGPHVWEWAARLGVWSNKLENVEHCGGEPEQADTGYYVIDR